MFDRRFLILVIARNVFLVCVPIGIGLLIGTAIMRGVTALDVAFTLGYLVVGELGLIVEMYICGEDAGRRLKNENDELMRQLKVQRGSSDECFYVDPEKYM